MKIEKVPIDLDKRRHLVYDLDAIYELEKLYGSFMEAIKTVRLDAFDDTTRLLYFGLRHEDETINEIVVDQLIDVTNRMKVIERIIQAASLSLPDTGSNQAGAESKGNEAKGWDWAWLYYVGTVLFGMSETVFWRCTPRKLFALLAMHRKVNGLDPTETPEYKKTQAWIDQYM
ncbi:hypothetical protein [Paenibacillus sp. SN-8-1]|uniref:hypothetical protein n=1 Tax=Paenibacillus sp. SN-8-1 TaxID=3435409 RepID=UPI003D9A9C97